MLKKNNKRGSYKKTSLKLELAKKAMEELKKLEEENKNKKEK